MIIDEEEQKQMIANTLRNSQPINNQARSLKYGVGNQNLPKPKNKFFTNAIRFGTHPYSKPYEKYITKDIYDKANNLKKELLNLPTEYFEIKPQRAVKINEFSGAIIPKNSLKSTKNILEKNGIKKIYEYSNDAERKKLFDKFPELMFTTGAAVTTGSIIKNIENEEEYY